MCMKASDNRLARTRDFNLLMKYGQWLNGRLFDIKVLELARITDFFPKKENPEKFKKQLRLAYSVGVKISKKAVERNRLRRQLRESVRLFLKNNSFPQGLYLLFVAKKIALNESYAEISQEVELLMTKIKKFVQC